MSKHNQNNKTLYRAAPGGMVDAESLRNNLASIADSLRELAQAINNHAIDLESMMPEDGPPAKPLRR